MSGLCVLGVVSLVSSYAFHRFLVAFLLSLFDLFVGRFLRLINDTRFCQWSASQVVSSDKPYISLG